MSTDTLEGYDALMEGVDTNLVRFPVEETELVVADSDLWQDAWCMQNGIEDRYIPVEALRVDMEVDSASRVYPVLKVSKSFEETDTFQFTSTSFAQLCERSGMSMISYMKKCLREGLPHLVLLNLNAWLAKLADRQLLLRIYDGQVIAFLSDKYGIFDHGDALDCLNEALNGDGQYRIEGYSLTVDNMNVRLVDVEGIPTVEDGSHGRDLSTAGLVFRNGQTGKSAASIEFMVYTLACTNGLIVAQDRGMVYRRRHVNIDKTEFAEQIRGTLSEFPTYVAEARKDMEKARSVRLGITEQERLRDKIQKDLMLSEETAVQVVDFMNERWDANAWGFAGAITEVAQQFSAERQYQLERYAGRLAQELSVAA